MTVTAVDNLPDYMAEIRNEAKQKNLNINAVTEDASQYSDSERYNLVICMGNSLQFFDAAGVQRILNNISSMLEDGGHVLINSWSLAEISWQSFKPKGWSQVGDVKFLTDSRYLAQPTRIETASTMISSDGSVEEKTAIDYIYSLNEMENMLRVAGLTLKEVFSIPGRKKFTPGEPRAYIVAVK
jgi:2-polyprenyl-3-methyl-5-hydroxy-6-metoxy-1,4-benzoquinol methylase